MALLTQFRSYHAFKVKTISYAHKKNQKYKIIGWTASWHNNSMEQYG